MSEDLVEIDFISPCPVEKCKNKNKMYRWLHVNCSGREKLSSEGEIRCLECKTHGPFVDWLFDCGEHDYKEVSAQGVAHALGIMAQIAVAPEEQLFIAKTTGNIMKDMVARQMQRSKNIK